MPKPSGPKPPDAAARRTCIVRIHDLDPKGRGAGRAGGNADGKMTFVHGALPGEEVVCRRVGRRRGFDEAVVQEVVEPSPDRVEPRCRFYERCGGCGLQHLSYDAQLRHKERMLLTALSTGGNVSPAEVMPPLAGSPWRYRRKARLGVRYVAGRYGALVGFRERAPNRIADMTDCEVLAEPLGRLVMPLRELVGALQARARIPQVEVAAGENGAVLVIRHLDPLSTVDAEAIEAFAVRHGIGIRFQPGGADSARPFAGSPSDLHYSLDGGAVRLSFSPLDFVQVNAEVNRALVHRVVSMLAPAPGERVLDAYCGLGNFSLPLAARGAAVTGLEAGAEMVGRARANAAGNALPASFHRADLGDEAVVRDWLGRGWNKLLIDPPRSGAEVLVEHVRLAPPSRIVYVSCNPDTLARDAARLVHGHGYRLVRTGLVDMFPHTGHIESVTEFRTGEDGGSAPGPPAPEGAGRPRSRPGLREASSCAGNRAGLCAERPGSPARGPVHASSVRGAASPESAGEGIDRHE